MHLLNADLAEGYGQEALLIPFLGSASIACGYHAGSEVLIRETILHCAAHGVRVGAHPSFADRTHFGRRDLSLSADAVYELVREQLVLFSSIAAACGVRPSHVKPHGALYNRSASDPHTAAAIARAVKDQDPALVLYGMSGSASIREARRIGLLTAQEVFADRSYQDDGSLTPRDRPGALLIDAAAVVQQVRQLLEEGVVTTQNGLRIPLQADTVCLHGDAPHVVSYARALHEAFP
ncbi:MAG: hypothetical protein RJA57_1353 [Bacteroidota bacterium]